MVFLLTLIISVLLQFFLPWWIIAPIAFLVSFWKSEGAGMAFISGFFAILVSWIGMGLFKTLPNDNILANRVGQMFGFPDLAFNWIILLLITGIVGGLAGGFSALAGFYCKSAMRK